MGIQFTALFFKLPPPPQKKFAFCNLRPFDTMADIPKLYAVMTRGRFMNAGTGVHVVPVCLRFLLCGRPDKSLGV